jgi:hypothetical protein
VPLSLANTTPASELLTPGSPYQFSVKATGNNATLGSLSVKMGISRLLHGSTFPEDDQNLLKYGEVKYTSPEGTLPYTGECVRSLSSGGVVLRKQTDDTADLGVYEYKVPVSPGMSSLAYFKVRKTRWVLDERPWVSYSPVTGLRLGVKTGLQRTSCDLFLWDDGADGALLVTGPINGPSRSHEVDYAFPWKTVPDGGFLEFWVHLDLDANSPEFEVWGSLNGAAPYHVATVPTASMSLGQAAVEDSFTAYFGNGGFAGDVVEIMDWGVYPDFRNAARFADATPNHSIFILPDGPVTYRATTGKTPNETVPSRWTPIGDTHPSFGYATGRKVVPQAVVIDKYLMSGDDKVAYTGKVGFERQEPVLRTGKGFMMEALMSGFAKVVDIENFGAGIAINDGKYSYRSVFYKTATRNTIAVQTNEDATSLVAQRDPGKEIDWEEMKLVRLAVDKDYGTVRMWVDDEIMVDATTGNGFPKSSKTSFEFGHIADAMSQGQVSVAFVNYVTNYQSYEAGSGSDPSSAANPMTQRKVENGNNILSNGVFEIQKKAIHSRGSKYEYFTSLPINVSTGVLLDFRACVPIFWDPKGTPMAAAAYTGAGVALHLGSKVFKLGFYNCGVHGKYLGVLPGSGAHKDIVEQTALGRKFSAPADWTKMENYRVVIRAYDRIEIWVGKTTNLPAIVIPWLNDTEGFDLPTEAPGQESGLSFGHEYDLSASYSRWEWLRWGRSTGYDLAVSQGYPNGVRSDQYGGKMLALVDMTEDN